MISSVVCVVPGMFKYEYLWSRTGYTHTLSDVISIVPVGFALNTNDDSAMAAKRAIMHDEKSADKLFTRAILVCILGALHSRRFV
jgi:hypothetical protein